MAKTIALAGTQKHIGTTTQAIQIIQYLQLMGNKACYVEMYEGKYLQNMKKAFEDAKESNPGQLCFNHVEMYEQQYMKGFAKKDYDYLVKDYGNIFEADFNKASYMEQGTKIFVAGLKANEIFYTFDVLRRQEFDDVSFILSFIENTVDTREAMKTLFDYSDGRHKYSRSEKVFFANYTPDPFEYTGISNKVYSDLLNVER